MRLGVAIPTTDPWGFFEGLYCDFNEHFETTFFESRVPKVARIHSRLKRVLFNRDLKHFMRVNDVVFFEWASEYLVAASMLPKTCGIVTRLHRYEMYQWVNSVRWDMVDKIILVSEAKCREFVRRFPNQAHKALVIPEVISVEKFQPQIQDFQGNIGTMCELLPRKRVYELILAFHELVQNNEELHLHIGGGANPSHEDYIVAIRELVEVLGLQNKVTFYGNVVNPVEWFRHIDIFISNSYSEGLQVATLEAMASGCYCLSHRWAGAEEQLPLENLFYTEHELQSKILTFCRLSETDKRTQKKLMRELVCQHFDINEWKAPFRQVIYEAVGK